MRWLLLIAVLIFPSFTDAACTGSRPNLSCTGDKATLIDAFTDGAPYGARQDGETINVIAGNWTWGGLLVDYTVNKPGFILKGAGQEVTIFTSDGSTNASFNGMLTIDKKNASTSLIILQDFTIDGNNLFQTGGYLNLMGQGLDKFRVHHVNIKNIGGTSGQSSRGFSVYGNSSSTTGNEFTGLFDHVQCQKATSATDCFAIYGSWSGGNDRQFQWPKQLGTNHAIYVEDSTCTFNTISDDCTDGKLGGAFVFRYNTLNFGVGAHGADSTFRGDRQLEVYRNTFLDTPTNSHAGINFRGGGDIAFDNTYHADFINLSFTIYRTSGYTGWGSFGESPARGICDGTSTWDGNLGSGTPSVAATATPPVGDPGWPCLDQIGWFFPGPGAHGSTVQFWPAYYWQNIYTVGGANVPFLQNDQIALPINNGDTWSTNYIVANRDYYTDGGASCTGGGACTSGVGVGTSLPTTCTPDSATNALAATRGGGTGGVGFWKTNSGTWNVSGNGDVSGQLYKCTDTNTWTLYYEPYTYPHPLQGSAPAIPAAPTGLRKFSATTATSCTVTWAEAGLANLVGYHLQWGTSTGNYSTVINKTAALSAAAHQPPRQHTFNFPIAGIYYITVTSYSDTVADSAAATEITCTSTGVSRTAATTRSAR